VHWLCCISTGDPPIPSLTHHHSQHKTNVNTPTTPAHLTLCGSLRLYHRMPNQNQKQKDDPVPTRCPFPHLATKDARACASNAPPPKLRLEQCTITAQEMQKLCIHMKPAREPGHNHVTTSRFRSTYETIWLVDHQHSSLCIVAVSTCASVSKVVCKSFHQVGRKCLAMMRNQGDQRSPLDGSIIA
jgi:hypothetical protein